MIAIAWGIDYIAITSTSAVANIIRDNSNWIDLVAAGAFVIAAIVAEAEVIAVAITALVLLSKRVE